MEGKKSIHLTSIYLPSNQRNLPSRGFRPSIYLFGLIGICSYGFYYTMAGIREQRELKREKLWARFYLQPVLEAEADRDMVRRHYARIAREQEIMKDVEGWDAEENVYHDKKFRNPSYAVLPKW